MNSKSLLMPLLLIVAGLLFMPQLMKGCRKEQPGDSKPADAKAPPAAAAGTGLPPVRVWRPGETANREVGVLDPRTGIPFQLDSTGVDAGVSKLRLTDHYETVSDKKLAEKYRDDPAKYEEACRKEPTRYQGHYALVKTVTSPDGQASEPYGTRLAEVESLAAPAVPASVPASRPADASAWKVVCSSKEMDKEPRRWELLPAPASKGAGDWASYRLRVADEQGQLLQVTKTYAVTPKDYTFLVTLEVRNVSKDRMARVWLDQYGPTGVTNDEVGRGDTRLAAYGRGDGKNVQVLTKPVKDAKDLTPGNKKYLDEADAKGPVVWVGFVNKYFGSMMHLRPDAKADKTRPAPKYFLSSAAVSSDDKTFLTGASIESLELAPGAVESYTFEVFAGPKRFDLFAKEPYKSLNYDGTVDLSGCFCAWRPLVELMMWLLRLFSGVGNYGIAIIMLVILVRVAVHPLSRKSQVSMMKMKKLQPLMAKLREKYKDDKDTLNREMMKLYKEQGAMPFLGCLPMFLQMPILIALWYSINATVELRHAAFLPWWITDLSAPDCLFPLPFNIPWVNIHTFNLLPLLLGVAMYWQMKVNPQAMGGGGGAAVSPEQEKSQKMMQYMMVVLMPVMFYNFASGLSLYFMASTFIGAAEQSYIRKHIEEQEALKAATETTVDAPGKGSRATRPKKPKGPMWFKRG